MADLRERMYWLNWRQKMGDATCIHVDEIADALARHDFPGMPSIDELDEPTRVAYRDIAESVLANAVIEDVEPVRHDYGVATMDNADAAVDE